MTNNPSKSSLRLIGYLGPLIGLVGTLPGMVTMFDDIARSETPPGLDVLSRGIASNLLVTLSLLLLVMPLMIFWLYRQKN